MLVAAGDGVLVAFEESRIALIDGVVEVAVVCRGDLQMECAQGVAASGARGGVVGVEGCGIEMLPLKGVGEGVPAVGAVGGIAGCVVIVDVEDGMDGEREL